MQIDRNSSVALYEQVANLLAAEIASGRRRAFDRLPSEQECMKMLGVSRVTVRQAIGLLEKRGVVEVRQGKGTYVAGPVVQHELEELRGFYDALVTEGLSPTTRLLAFEPQTPPAEVAATLQSGEAPAIRLKRLYELHGQPFALARAWLPPGASRVAWEDAATHPLYSILQKLLGLRVERADVGIIARAVDDEESRLLALPPSSPVLIMERVSYGSDGRALECSCFTIRPENYRFTLSVRGPLAITRKIREVAPAGAAARIPASDETGEH